MKPFSTVCSSWSSLSISCAMEPIEACSSWSSLSISCAMEPWDSGLVHILFLAVSLAAPDYARSSAIIQDELPTSSSIESSHHHLLKGQQNIINNLVTELELDMAAVNEEVPAGEIYYLLVRKVNDAVEKGALTQVEGSYESDSSGKNTELYTVPGEEKILVLPSIREMDQANVFLKSVRETTSGSGTPSDTVNVTNSLKYTPNPANTIQISASVLDIAGIRQHYVEDPIRDLQIFFTKIKLDSYPGEDYYRLVLKVNEALEKELITRTLEDITTCPMGMRVERYNVRSGYDVIPLPSISDLQKAIDFFEKKRQEELQEKELLARKKPREKTYVDLGVNPIKELKIDWLKVDLLRPPNEHYYRSVLRVQKALKRNIIERKSLFADKCVNGVRSELYKTMFNEELRLVSVCDYPAALAFFEMTEEDNEDDWVPVNTVKPQIEYGGKLGDDANSKRIRGIFGEPIYTTGSMFRRDDGYAPFAGISLADAITDKARETDTLSNAGRPRNDVSSATHEQSHSSFSVPNMYSQGKSKEMPVSSLQTTDVPWNRQQVDGTFNTKPSVSSVPNYSGTDGDVDFRNSRQPKRKNRSLIMKLLHRLCFGPRDCSYK